MATRRAPRRNSASPPPATTPAQSRRTGAVVAVVALAVVLVLFLSLRDRHGANNRKNGDGEGSAPESAGKPGDPAGRGIAGLPRPSPPDDDSAPPPPGGAPPGLAHLPPGPPPYPPGSQPLTEGADPSTQPKDEVPISPRDGLTCIFGPRRAVVHPPDALVIDLEVHNSLGARMPIRQGIARFRPDKSDATKGPWFEVPFKDDGAGKDLAASDLAYTATFLPSAKEEAAIFAGGSHLFVEVVFDAPQGNGPRKFPTVMEYSREPHASLNGNYDDDIKDGSLVIDAGVTATQAGDYRLIGSLYVAGTETTIAIASKAVHLEQGDGTIPLLFFGKILYDQGADGPYELRYEMLSEEIVGQEVIPGDTVDHAYTTKVYHARNFSSASYVAPPPAFETVDRFSPSQRGKPPPLLGDDQEPNPLPSATTRAAPVPTSSAK